MKKLPYWYWLSLIIFVVYSYVSIPVSAMFASHARWVAATIFINGVVIFPVLACILFILVFLKVKLDSDERIWAFLILFVPILTYLPLWSILS